LESAYAEALRICREHEVDSVAFPAISTGVYGYPLNEAATVACGVVANHLAARGVPRLVRFVLFDEAARGAFERAARAAASRAST
jgi:O-acetyl-ADP-ribose deacetylase (regulator of RNase III)